MRDLPSEAVMRLSAPCSGEQHRRMSVFRPLIAHASCRRVSRSKYERQVVVINVDNALSARRRDSQPTRGTARAGSRRWCPAVAEHLGIGQGADPDHPHIVFPAPRDEEIVSQIHRRKDRQPRRGGLVPSD